ncbi:MAG: prenyltransferase/squalene oxidase repeat-containing protein [Cyanobacteriota bacterium]
MRRPDGLWHDFQTLAGTSNDWVSGVVLHAFSLAGPGPWSQDIHRSLTILLRRQRPNGGWSYNEQVPTDCDSTAWVLRALQTGICWRASALLRGARYLLRHQDGESGAFSTYAPSDHIERTIEAAPGETVGWLGGHLGVSCVALQSLLGLGVAPTALRVTTTCHYIQRERRLNGLWSCYWWRGWGYATHQALRALAMADDLSPTMATAVAAAILERQLPDGSWGLDDDGGEPSAFETVHMLQSLLLLAALEPKLATKVDRGMRALLAFQKRDGSFVPLPILRLPAPMTMDAHVGDAWKVDLPGTQVLVSDCERVFTTACALAALSQAIG